MNSAPVIKIKKFLVLTENQEYEQFFKVLLREKQMDVSTSDDGEAALQIVENKRIQFVIVEREMKKMTGGVFAQRLREKRQLAHVPCLLFSDKLSDENIRLCRELGVAALRMPVNKADAFRDIEEICRQEEQIDSLELSLRIVDNAIAEKQYSQARSLLKNATKFAAPSARTETLFGEIELEEGNDKEAEKRLSTAVQQNPTYVAGVRLLAKVYSRTQRHPQAIQLLSTIAERSPQNLTTLLSLAGAYTAAQETEKAKNILARIRSLDPGSKSAKSELGKIALAEDNIDEAEKCFSELGDVDETARMLNTYAIGLVGRDEFEKAIKSYKVAIRILSSKNSDKILLLQYNLGLAMKKKDNLAIAFTLLASCVMADPTYAKAFQALSSIVAQMKRKKIAYDTELYERIKSAVSSQKKTQ